jgi:hypothetical protein
MQVAGILLALVLLAIYAVALWIVVRAPFRALGVLVAGMAFHNFLIMALLRLDTPGFLVRIVQAWKEGILLLLLAMVAVLGIRAIFPPLSGEGQGGGRTRSFPRLLPLDYVALALTLITVIYLLLPHRFLPGGVSLTQRLVGARVILLLPLLYLFGRVFRPRRGDAAWVTTAIVSAAALVGLLGTIELWLIPTRAWLDLGVNQFSAWLGFHYDGPKGLPPNFFQSAGTGYYLRRMVSSYVSPLGIAYAGLLVVPAAAVLLLQRRRLSWFKEFLAWAGLALLVTGMLFSLTRLAIFLMVAEFLLLAVLFRKRWLLYATPVVGGLALLMLVGYVHFGPLVTADLQTVAHRPPNLRITGVQDPSVAEHSTSLAKDLQYVLQHPLGTGPGSSVNRFGASIGTGESAVLDMFGDLGMIGGVLYLILYMGCTILAALAFWWTRNRGDPVDSVLPLVAIVGGLALLPITVTSDVWGDFATTFLLWWAFGASVTAAAQVRAGALLPAASL